MPGGRGGGGYKTPPHIFRYLTNGISYRLFRGSQWQYRAGCDANILFNYDVPVGYATDIRARESDDLR